MQLDPGLELAEHPIDRPAIAIIGRQGQQTVADQLDPRQSGEKGLELREQAPVQALRGAGRSDRSAPFRFDSRAQLVDSASSLVERLLERVDPRTREVESGGFGRLRGRSTRRLARRPELEPQLVALGEELRETLLEQSRAEAIARRLGDRRGRGPAQHGLDPLAKGRAFARDRDPHRPVGFEFRIEHGTHPRHGETAGSQSREREVAGERVAPEQKDRFLGPLEQRPWSGGGRVRPGSAELGQDEWTGDVDRAVFGEREGLSAPEGGGPAVRQTNPAKRTLFHESAGIEDANRSIGGLGIFSSELHVFPIDLGMRQRPAIETMMTDWLPTLNQLVSRWETIAAVASGIVLWAALSALWLARAGRRIRSALAAASERLAVEPDGPVSGERFESLRRKLAKDERIECIKAPWSAFADSVVVPLEPGRPVRATRPPDQLFDLGLYRRVDTDLRYHTALPGLLVGAGLLFTFFGLAIALANAGAIVTASDQAARSTSLRGLLDAASIKFVTSLVGLVCSIGFALFRKGSVKKTEAPIDDFCTLLEARFPLATPAFFQAEANRALEAQRNCLDTLANDLAQSLGPALDKAFDTRLGEHLGPLRAAIEKLAARDSESLGRTLEAMLERFLEKLEASSGARLAEVGAQLAQAAQGLESLRAGLSTAAATLSHAAGTLPESLAKGSDAAAGRLEQAAGLIQSGAERLAKASDGLAGRLDALAGRLAEETQALQAALRATGRELQAAAAEAAQKLQGAAGPFAAVTRGLKESTETLQRTNERIEGLAKGVAATVSGFDAVARALDDGIRQVRNVSAQLGETSARVAGLDESLGRTLERLGGQYEAFAQRIGETVRQVDEHLAKAVSSLQSSINELSEAIEDLENKLPLHNTRQR